MSKSENLYSAARELIPGGVNSPVRAFTGVGGTPLFIEKADGAYLYDVDGKAYIDYVGSWRPDAGPARPGTVLGALCAPRRPVSPPGPSFRSKRSPKPSWDTYT